MDAVNQHGDSSDLVDAAQRWVASFGAAPLAPDDASDLVAGALKVTQAVSQAARELTWQAPDAFLSAMRRMEQADGR
ncbi:hypothetical protein [Rhodoferax sediminis]|uniref:Uncharacterized protein n=1 Tax=Rhodoferax sediminis TaxID=2509614 RepID=A0A515DEG5_9BURK|nr:hypothetical protein [Rhodoferax sediminis]QDL38779.1 hypothetical protein EUB48_16930 [Rhodoferax sediminis]